MKHAFATLYKDKIEIKQEFLLYVFFILFLCHRWAQSLRGASVTDPDTEKGAVRDQWGFGKEQVGELGQVFIVGACTDVSRLSPGTCG